MHTGSTPHYSSVEPKDFTQALSLAANGVTIVTTNGAGGKAGLTVSSMCSVCAEPPVVLVCVNNVNEFCSAIHSNQCFAINLLATTQTTAAEVFAGMTKDPDHDRFLTGEWQTLKTNSPILNDALVSLDCELSAQHSHGTHHIYIGRVVALKQTAGKPLVYSNRTFEQTTSL